MVLRIDYLNHASTLIDDGHIALLSDPWFHGHAFSGGWGLRYHNPDAMAIAARATHLWISHWHSDHLHPETLSELALRMPHLHVLSNESANFSMTDRLRGLGFAQMTDLPERRQGLLDGGVSVERFPTAGADSALVLRTPGCTILNYNDCNLPAGALAALVRKCGPIDVLLASYNHAGKLFVQDGPDAIKRSYLHKLLRTIEIVSPKVAIPFASSHYYRSPDSFAQNASLLSFDELERACEREPRLCVLRIGDRVELDNGGELQRIARMSPALEPVALDMCDYGKSMPERELLEMSRAYVARLRHGFPVLARLSRPLHVRVRDLGCTLRFDCANARCSVVYSPAHINVHSQGLRLLLARRFGADTFVAGAHFAIEDPDTRVIERFCLLALLAASHMTERDALGYLGTQHGRRFLWCRREEIVATVTAQTFKAGQLPLE